MNARYEKSCEREDHLSTAELGFELQPRQESALCVPWTSLKAELKTRQVRGYCPSVADPVLQFPRK